MPVRRTSSQRKRGKPQRYVEYSAEALGNGETPESFHATVRSKAIPSKILAAAHAQATRAVVLTALAWEKARAKAYKRYVTNPDSPEPAYENAYQRHTAAVRALSVIEGVIRRYKGRAPLRPLSLSSRFSED